MKLSEEEKKKRFYQKQNEQRFKNAVRLREKQIQKQKDNKGQNCREFKTKKQTPIKKVSDKQKDIWNKDRAVYLEVWNNNPNHRCEECGKYLGHLFEENGKVLDLFRYSHILAKGNHPKLRHYVLNFRLYCLKCHQKWEFSSEEEKKSMKTYDENLIKHLLEYEHSLYNK